MSTWKIILAALALPLGLTSVFTALKVAGKISWSWTWVLSPIWIYLLIGIVAIISIIIIAKAIDKMLRR